MLVADDGAKVDFVDLYTRGMRGVRYNLLTGASVDFLVVQSLVDRLLETGGCWHLALHGTPQTLVDLESWSELGVPIVIDHCGRLDLGRNEIARDVEKLLNTMENPAVWMKLSGIDRMSRIGSPFGDAAPIARQLFHVAPERCIWGTDFPHPNHDVPPHDADLIDAIPAIAETTEDQHRLLIENPRRLFEGT